MGPAPRSSRDELNDLVLPHRGHLVPIPIPRHSCATLAHNVTRFRITNQCPDMFAEFVVGPSDQAILSMRDRGRFEEAIQNDGEAACSGFLCNLGNALSVRRQNEDRRSSKLIRQLLRLNWSCEHEVIESLFPGSLLKLRKHRATPEPNKIGLLVTCCQAQ